MTSTPFQKSVAIIVINWNSYKYTNACFNSLRKISYENFKIILVDNGSEDGSGEELKANYPEIELIKNAKNLGFTGGNNSGIRYALDKGYDYLLLLNNDTVVTRDFLDVLIDRIDSDSSIGAIQPKIFYNLEKDIIWNMGGFFNRTLGTTKTRGQNEQDNEIYDMEWFTDWVTGCCFLVRSDIIKEIGPLDDRLFIYYEDTDWSFRIKQKGFKLLVYPKARIYHEVGRSEDNRSSFGEGNLSPFSHYVTVRNHIFIIKRYVKGWRLLPAILYQSLKVITRLAYFTIKLRPKKFRATLKGVRDGLKG